MSWHNGTLTAFDLESTGTDPETARIVTATVIRIDVATKTIDARSWLANPGVEIPEQATAVHGITTDHAREHGRASDEVVLEVEQALQDAWINDGPVVIYNAPYDLTVLDREMRRHNDGLGIDGIGPIVDPLVLDKAVDRYRKGSRRLADTCRHYGVTLTDDDAHTSTGDALAAARLAWALANRYPLISGATLDDLQQQQAAWFAEQSASFAAYLRRIKQREGATAEELDAIKINTVWPLIPHTNTEIPA